MQRPCLLRTTYQTVLSRTNKLRTKQKDHFLYVGCQSIYYGKPNIRLGWAWPFATCLKFLNNLLLIPQFI